MRERWARLLALLTGVVVLLLAAAFALLQNPTRSSPATADPPSPLAAAVEVPSAYEVPAANEAPVALTGRSVFDEQRCARCHSIAGKGNPRSPLDGVGGRLSREEIRQWIVADDAIRDDLSPRALSAKQGYAALPAAQLDALVDYLHLLRE